MKQNKIHIGIVVSEYNSDITEKMSEIAQSHAKSLGVIVKMVVKVPGAFEIPFAVKKLLIDKEIDGVVTLGAVIKGETSHDEVIAHSIARKILDLSLEYGKAVSLGVSGPNVTREQAIERIESYAKHAVESVVRMTIADNAII